MKKLTAAGVVAAGLLLATGVGCGRRNENAAAENGQSAIDTIPVRVITLEPREFEVRGDYYGEVAGVEEALLVCAAGGRVEALHVKEGAYVKAGQHLGNINADEAINAYETATLSEKMARDNHERLQEHLKAGNASQVAVDQARLNWLNAKSAMLKAGTARRGALCITPISGFVIKRHVELYQELPPGTPTFTVAKLHTMKVNVGIPESDIADVKTGNKAVITFDLHPGRRWEGTLVRLAREISNRTRTFDAELHIPNKDRTLVSGLTAHVRLTLRTLRDQIVAPTGAIRTDKKESFVMTVKNGRAVYRAVELGAASQTHTVITGGLKAGDVVIVGGQHLVSNGTPVEIIE